MLYILYYIIYIIYLFKCHLFMIHFKIFQRKSLKVSIYICTQTRIQGVDQGDWSPPKIEHLKF